MFNSVSNGVSVSGVSTSSESLAFPATVKLKIKPRPLELPSSSSICPRKLKLIAKSSPESFSYRCRNNSLEEKSLRDTMDTDDSTDSSVETATRDQPLLCDFRDGIVDAVKHSLEFSSTSSAGPRKLKLVVKYSLESSSHTSRNNSSEERSQSDEMDADDSTDSSVDMTTWDQPLPSDFRDGIADVVKRRKRNKPRQSYDTLSSVQFRAVFGQNEFEEPKTRRKKRSYSEVESTDTFSLIDLADLSYQRAVPSAKHICIPETSADQSLRQFRRLIEEVESASDMSMSEDVSSLLEFVDLSYFKASASKRIRIEEPKVDQEVWQLIMEINERNLAAYDRLDTLIRIRSGNQRLTTVDADYIIEFLEIECAQPGRTTAKVKALYFMGLYHRDGLLNLVPNRDLGISYLRQALGLAAGLLPEESLIQEALKASI